MFKKKNIFSISTKQFCLITVYLYQYLGELPILLITGEYRFDIEWTSLFWNISYSFVQWLPQLFFIWRGCSSGSYLYSLYSFLMAAWVPVFGPVFTWRTIFLFIKDVVFIFFFLYFLSLLSFGPFYMNCSNSIAFALAMKFFLIILLTSEMHFQYESLII